jgi:hypothetical protein
MIRGVDAGRFLEALIAAFALVAAVATLDG